jgi:hypothetical protein
MLHPLPLSCSISGCVDSAVCVAPTAQQSAALTQVTALSLMTPPSGGVGAATMLQDSGAAARVGLRVEVERGLVALEATVAVALGVAVVAGEARAQPDTRDANATPTVAVVPRAAEVRFQSEVQPPGRGRTTRLPAPDMTPRTVARISPLPFAVCGWEH